MSPQEMLEIESWTKKPSTSCGARAKDVLLHFDIAREESVEEVSQICVILRFDAALIARFAEFAVHTRDELADLSVDELD